MKSKRVSDNIKKMKSLSSPIDLLKKAVEIFFKKENFVYFLKLMLIVLVVSFGVGLLATLPSGGLVLLTGQDPSQNPIWILPLLAGAIAMIILSIWMQAVIYESVRKVFSKESLEIKITLKSGWAKTWKFFLVGLALMFIIVFGLLLLIIPGIIFAVWFSFSQFIMISEGLGVRASLAKSKGLVKGRFWPIFGRFIVFALVIGIFQILLSLVPFVGGFTSLFFTPLFILPSYLLYQELSG
jgi:hypothetical protein